MYIFDIYTYMYMCVYVYEIIKPYNFRGVILPLGNSVSSAVKE